jgi:nucleotide-binding universal stress UspA family protein
MRILVAFDFSPASHKALTWAADLQRMTSGAPIHVVHVVNPIPSVAMPEMTAFPAPTEEEIAGIAREVETVVHKSAPNATTEVIRAPWVASAILDSAHRVNADLIAMGTHGRKGFTRLMLGSAAEYVVRHATCPVVTLHSDAPPAS